MKFARQNNLPPELFLLALTSSANIGSSATPIGNPQNLIIAVQSGISFGKFATGIVPAMLLGIVINMVIILCMYWRLLSSLKDEEQAVPELVVEDEVEERWKRLLQKTCVYLVTLGMLIALLMGLNMSCTTNTTALVLIVVDFKDAFPCLKKVSYPLLLFFCGMFVTIDGFNKTGIPSAFLDLMEPQAQIEIATGIIVLAAVILVLSNVTSNVPTDNNHIDHHPQ